jgi:hypothetical protein
MTANKEHVSIKSLRRVSAIRRLHPTNRASAQFSGVKLGSCRVRSSEACRARPAKLSIKHCGYQYWQRSRKDPLEIRSIVAASLALAILAVIVVTVLILIKRLIGSSPALRNIMPQTCILFIPPTDGFRLNLQFFYLFGFAPKSTFCLSITPCP